MGNMPVVEVGGRKVRVKRLLSEGGYARVYKAVDEVNKKEYALKMVRIPRGRSGQLANEEVAEMAVVEQSVVRSLPTNHPNIVRFHDAGISKAENEIRYYILSEYCPSNVRKKMSNAADQGNLLPEKEVLLTFRDALMAVLYLHSRDPPIAHRDLKVENLLVGRDGQIKLCDFGSCSTTHRAYYGSKDIQTANEDIRRNTTAAYRSPEQVDLFQGHVVSEKVDIWALGVILFELAFFQTPFEDNKGAVEGGAILKGLGDRKIPQEKHYSSGLVSLIKCCLVVDPERRPTIGQVIKLCEELKNSGSLPEWPGLNSLPRTPPHSSSSPFSPPPWDMMGDLSGSDRGVITGEKDLNRGSNGGGAERDGRGVGTTTSGERDCPSGGGGGGAGSGRGGGGGSNENAHTRSRSPDVCGSSAARHSGESYQYNQRNGLPRSNSRRSGAIAVAQTSNSDTSKNTGTTASPIASANACVSASPRRSQRLNRTNPGSGDWIGRVGDGMRSKWYKLMGGEQRKRLWVLKTTSQNATGPKPKYVGKLVAALWEKELTMGSVFTLLRDRPLAESPVVAMKALVTTMKLLQQGPPEVLAESTTYAPVVEEIGQMWCLNETWTSSPISAGASSGGRARGAGSGGTGTYEVSGESPESGGTAGTVNSSGTGGVGMDLPTMTLDPTLSRLISRLATMIVEKIRFHEHHPEYASYWSPETGNDTDTTPTTYDRPVQERLPEQDANDEPRTLKVISRLLLVQTSIICTMTEAFILLNKGAKDAGPSTRSALLPLMAESYLTYFATTRVLLTVSEKYSSTTSRRGKPRPENLVALSRQYDKDLKVMRELYKRADEVEEVAVMKRTPRLPAVSPLSEGGAKQFRELSRKTSRQSTFGRASSKMEALKTLQDEERTFVDSNRSRQSTGHMFNSDGDVVEEDDGASENDDSDHDGNNLVIGEESFFGASDRQSQGYGAGAGVGGSGGKVIKCIDSDGGRRLIRVSSNGLIVSLSSNSTTPFDDDDYKGGWGGGDGDARIAGAGAGAGAGTAEASTSEGVARSSNDGDNHDGVGTDDGGGPWEDGSDDDTSGGWGPDGEGDGDGGGGKWARPPKDLRLEVSDESEWSSSNYCTSRGPNSCAPSSGQARESTFGVRRRLLDEDGRVSKTWATDGSGSGSIVVGRGGGGGKLSSRGGPGVSSFPTYPSPRPSSAELNASAAVAAAVATAAAAQRRTSSGMEPNGGGAGGRARGGEGGSRRPSLSLSVEDGGRYTASPRKPPEQMAGGVAWGRSGRKGGGGGGRRDEVHPAEQTASSSMTLRSDMRQDRVGEALMSDFETITLGEGGDGRSMSPSVSTEGMTAAYHIPAAIGRGPSALRRERTHPPPLPPRRDHEGSPTSSAAADGSGEVAYDLSYSNASGASAGVGAPPLPPRLVSATAEPSTVSGGRSAGQNAVRRREGYPGASPARRRGSGSLPQPTQDQEQQNEKHQDGAGSSYSIQSPRLIKGGFGPAMSWTVPAAPSNKGNRRHPITEATAGGRGAGDGVRGGAGAGKSAVVPTTGGNLGGRSSASRGAQAQEPGSGALVAGANARVTGSGKTAQQQQQHHLNQKQQKHGGRHTRAASSGAPTPSNAEAPKSTSRDAVSASPSTKRTRAVSGNLDKVAQGAIGGLRPAAGGGGGGSGAAGDGSACVGGGGGVPVAETGKLAVAKYEYTAQGPEQLSFRVGDIVHVHTEKMNAKGWSLGLANGKVGWFPGDFVEIRSPPPAEKKTRTSGGSGKNAASRSRRQHPNAGAGGPAGGGDTAAQGQGQGRGAAPPPPYPGRNQQQQQQRPARGAASAAAAGGEQHHQQAGAELYREADDWGTERERARTEGGGGRQPEQLPEHVFAIQMAKNQPWKDRLTPGGKAAYDDLLALFKASRMVLNFEEIDLKSVIGSGAFATVFRGIFRHKVGRPGEGGDKKMEVAVKKLVGGGGGPMEKTLKDFKLECVMLSRLKHRNIIALVGATTDPVTCVMQYCSRGNLMVLLDDRSIDLTWKMKRQMMLDVAMGMKYLHGQNPVIIHRDLKSLNVLIDENWITKVTDFGLSRFKATSVSEKMTGQAGTYHWMAPEVINSQHYTEKADVFSYGIILWEIFTRAIPYGGMQPVQVVAAVLGRRERPRIPSRCPSALSKLMQACWNHEPDQRPSFEDVVPWLESL